MRYKGKFSTIESAASYDTTTQMFNPLAGYDTYVVCRGIIAGCIMISNAAIYYKIWICAILGAFGGLIFIGTSLIAKKFKFDDPLHIF